MAIDVGDLIPSTSGSASLGVEQIGKDGWSTDIRPFAHIHMNSGIIHGPNGASGIIRYEQNDITLSVDGGVTYEKLDLQRAYDRGNAIHIDAPQRNHVGILVQEQTGGLAHFLSLPTLGSEVLNFGIAVSGFSPNTSNPNNYAFAKLGSNALVIRSSGTASTPASTLLLGFEAASPSVARLVTSGILTLQAVTAGSSVGAMDFSTSTSFSLAAGTTIIFGTSDGDVIFTAGAGGDGLGGQIAFNAFASSGELEYRFGPFEAWHCSPSHTSSFFPIPHSGQVVQMMLERIGLQQTYTAGPSVILSSVMPAIGHLIVTANTAKPKFSTFGTRSEIYMSGVPAAFPSSDMERGDMTMMAHGFVDQNPFGQTTLAGVQARSLGLGTLGINTGSGVANVMMGSGIQRYLDTAGGASITTFPTFANIPIASERFQHDQYYAYDSSVTGVRVFVPGLYLVIGKITVASSAVATVFTRLAVNGAGLAGTGDNGPVLNLSTAAFTVHALLNLHARDYLSLQASTSTGTVTSVANETVFHIVYFGPPRGQLS